ERAEGLRRLVVRATGGRRHDHCHSATQAELQADVIRPEPRDFPVDERHLAADVDAVELSPAASPDDDELRSDAAGGCFGNTAERRAFKAHTVVQLDVRVFEPPRVDGDRFLDDVDQTSVPHLRSDEAGRRAFLGRTGDAEAEWMRSIRLEPLDDMTEVLGGDAAHGIPSSTPISVSATRSPSV